MHRYYMYILECSDSSYYVGVTNNVEERFKQHSSGSKEYSYTASRLPVKLVYVEEYKYIDKAIKREKQVKRWSRGKKEALMRGDIDLVKRHSTGEKAITVMLRCRALNEELSIRKKAVKKTCQVEAGRESADEIET